MISTTEPSDRGAVVSFGCSVTSAIAIADGMGSRPESKTGALAATRCALKAAMRWTKHPSVGTDWLIRWLEAEWRYSLGSHDPKDCATTCWLIVASPDLGTLVMGLGDGLALLIGQNGGIEQVTGRDEANYSNETVALGTPHKMSDWKVRLLPGNPRYQTAILLTDGVADDLLDHKLDSFAAWVRSAAQLKHPGRGLRRVLKRWPVKSHSDDKTIASMIWTGTSSPQ